jgi:tetratricopeptide (TPR) repeat protein
VARLDLLGRLRQLANVGAAIGRRFSLGLLAEVIGSPAEPLRSDVDRLTQLGILSAIGSAASGSYVFRHALLRDAAYDSLLRGDRQTLHARIAAAILSRFPELVDTEPEVIAYHLAEGGSEADALPYWERAGLRAASRGAHEEAVRHYQAALSAQAKQGEAERRADREMDLLIALARSLGTTAGLSSEVYRDVLDRAHALCDSLGGEADLYPVLRGLCNYMVTCGNLDAGGELADRILRLGERTSNPACKIDGHSMAGFVAFYRGRFAEARTHLEISLDSYVEHDGAGLRFPAEPDPRVAGGSVLSNVLVFLGEPQAARVVSEETLHWARTLDRPFDIAYALNWVAGVEMSLGNPARAAEQASEAIDLCEDRGYGTMLGPARSSFACAMGQLGKTEAAISGLETVLEQFQREGRRSQIAAGIGQLALCYADAGRLDEALATIDRAIDHALRFVDHNFLAGLYLYRAHIQKRIQGVPATAVAETLRQALSVAESQGAIAFATRAKRLLERAAALQNTTMP